MSKMTYEQWENRYLTEEGSNYDRDFRFQFISDYLLNPNLAAICRKHNVPYDTAMSWKKKNWWYDMAEDILQNHKEELLAKQRKILEKTYDELGDRLVNGDEQYIPSEGHVRVKVRANHLATIADTTLKANQDYLSELKIFRSFFAFLNVSRISVLLDGVYLKAGFKMLFSSPALILNAIRLAASLN